MLRTRSAVCRAYRVLLASLVSGLTLITLAGCGQQAAVKKPGGATNDAGSANTASRKKSSPRTEPKVTTQDGKKYLDGIPYDVWFDDPLAVVSNTAAVTPAGENVASATPADSATAPAKPTATTTPEPKSTTAAGNDWAVYLAADQLQEESKRIRNQLKALLLSQKEYNDNFEVVKMDGAVISALAVIVSQSGEGINWKPNAPYIRDYGLQMFESAKGLGKPNYDATSDAHENLQSVFDGSIPAGAAEPEAAKPFADVANRFYLMKRMKLAFDALKLNINTEAKLKSELEQGLHEAMMLAALSKVITIEGYSSSDEAEYQGFAQEMIQQCLEAIQALKDQEFPKFQDAINKMDKTCYDCHMVYRGN